MTIFWKLWPALDFFDHLIIIFLDAVGSRVYIMVK